MKIFITRCWTWYPRDAMRTSSHLPWPGSATMTGTKTELLPMRISLIGRSSCRRRRRSRRLQVAAAAQMEPTHEPQMLPCCASRRRGGRVDRARPHAGAAAQMPGLRRRLCRAGRRGRLDHHRHLSAMAVADRVRGLSAVCCRATWAKAYWFFPASGIK